MKYCSCLCYGSSSDTGVSETLYVAFSVLGGSQRIASQLYTAVQVPAVATGSFAVHSRAVDNCS